MPDHSASWFTYPQKKHLWFFGLIWLISHVLLVLSITDLFRESLFQKGYLTMYLLSVGSSFMTATLFRNYFKNR